MLHSSRRLAPESKRRPTTVSQTLRAISADPDAWDVPALNGEEPKFRIRVASTLELRTRAYALAYRVYRHCGYVEENAEELCVSAYDAFAGTITLLAEDRSGDAVGTVSIVLDSPLALPCDEIYKDEVDALRQQGCSLVEITRLALEDNISDGRELLIYLFSMAYIFARAVCRCTDLLIEVTPRHGVFYQRLLCFRQVGPEKPCPRVQGTVGVLLRMECAEMEAALYDRFRGRDAQGRRLHKFPFTPRQQSEAASFLARQHQPMSFDELRHFRILPPLCPAV
ncbi:MAG TPA: hypothetical protein VEJ63_09615 [Planctomycetota bacterium]|nr:hypothetical protein [Planctomycetota bacterium]